jgi:hypothetical protein
MVPPLRVTGPTVSANPPRLKEPLETETALELPMRSAAPRVTAV